MQDKEHHKRELIFFLVFLILFALFFFVAVINIRRGLPVFGFGVSYFVEDSFVMLLSILAIFKILWHIIIH